MTNDIENTPERLLTDPTEPHRQKARFDPTINLGHVISASGSLIASIVFVMTSWAFMDKRVIVLEETKTYQTARDLAQDAAVRDKFNDVQRALDKLDANIDLLRRDINDARRMRQAPELPSR